MSDRIQETIDFNTENRSIKTLFEDIKKGFYIQEEVDLHEINEEIIIEYSNSIIVTPDYQRDYRSTVSEESAFIESILLGIPIPPIFFIKDKYKKIDVNNVVDGQHRLRAFYRFLDNKYKLTNLKRLSSLNDKYFNELDLPHRLRINEYTIICYIFKNYLDKVTQIEIFERYNKGTKPLSPQELRHAIYSSLLNNYVNDYVKKLYKQKSELTEAFNVTKDRLQKKKVQESIFVILAILENGIVSEYKNSTSYADEYMKVISEHNNEQEMERIIEEFEKYLVFVSMLSKIVEFPFTKEFYGISSRKYKFQISIAMIITAIYNKLLQAGLESLLMTKYNVVEKFVEIVGIKLSNSFIEDTNYNASSTNSIKIKELIDEFDYNQFVNELKEHEKEIDVKYNILSKAVDAIKLSLLQNNGEIHNAGGLNWGQREGREPNQAYIALPSVLQEMVFFPEPGIKFNVMTDDKVELIMVRQGENGKNITTSDNNSVLGVYFRNRLGLERGAFVEKRHLEEYGRTDVEFAKLDKLNYIMKFNVS